jgi:hypothetical protein
MEDVLKTLTSDPAENVRNAAIEAFEDWQKADIKPKDLES